MGYNSVRSRYATPGKNSKRRTIYVPKKNSKKRSNTKTRKTNSAPAILQTKRSKMNTRLKLMSRNKNSLEKDVVKIFEKNIFFIAYMNHVLFYNNRQFDKDLTHEQVELVKAFFKSRSDMEIEPLIPIISVIYNKYYSSDKSSDEIKRLFKIFKMDNALDNFMTFILKNNSNIIEMEGGIPPRIRAMLYILFFTISLLLLTYVVNISKNSTVKDLLESGNYIKNIYKNSQQCDISASPNNNHELLKRTINYLGLDSVDVGIFQNFLKSIECFNERNFEEKVIDELFESEDFTPVSESNQLVPMNNMALVTKNSQNEVVAISTDSTALVPPNYKFDKIVKNQIVTYVRNGITDPAKIEKLLKEINENPEKPASEKTYYELIYDTVSKNLNQESIAAALTGNTNHFMKQFDNTVDMIQDTIAEYNIASIKAKRMTEKVMTKTARGSRSIVYLVMMLITWYGWAMYCVTKIVVNMNKMRNLAIENGPTRQKIQNLKNLEIENGPSGH
jgi:hypothetical protein